MSARRLSLERFDRPPEEPAVPAEPMPVAEPPAEEEAAGLGPAAEPGPSPAEARIEAAAALLETLAGEGVRIRREAREHCCAAFAAAAAEALPALVDACFPAEVVAATREIAARAEIPELVLRAGVCEAEKISGLLASAGPAAPPMRVEADPGLGAGEARLDWDDGGAAFDAGALARAAIECLGRRIEMMTTQEAER